MDYFNTEERAAQEKFRVARDRFFDGFSGFLVKTGITPNQISMLGVVFLVIACLLTPNWYPLVGVLLLLYLLMDAIDGPLARKLNQSHEGGSIVDMLADQIGVVTIPAAAIWQLGASGVPALLFATGYLLLIVFVVLENELDGYRQRTFVRVKYPVYGLYVVSLYFVTTLILDWVFILFSAYYWYEIYRRTLSLHAYYGSRTTGNE